MEAAARFRKIRLFCLAVAATARSSRRTFAKPGFSKTATAHSRNSSLMLDALLAEMKSQLLLYRSSFVVRHSSFFMLVKTKAIVISSLRYQEKSLIVKCFTESDGLKSYFVHNAFSSRTASKKMAYFQPLNLLEIEASHKNKGTLETLKEIRIAAPYATVNTDIVKGTIAIFVSELLHNAIREEEKNPALFHFLETALLWFDHHGEVADFHLILMLQMTRFLGFYPTLTEDNAAHFDLIDGVFLDAPSYNSLNVDQTQLFRTLLSLRFDTPGKYFSAAARRELLSILTDYYVLHLEGFRRPKSVEILQQVFS